MAQVDPRALDYSTEMRTYFAEVEGVLVRDFQRSRTEARALIDRYFSLDVDPLERALVMHADPQDVAADLAGGQDSSGRHHP